MPPVDGAAEAPVTSTRARPTILIALAALLLAARIATGVHESLSPPRAGGLVTWVGPEEAAQSVKAGARKPILYDYSASWCGPCKQMEREVFSDADSAQYISEAFIPVRVTDEDQSEAAATLRRHHRVTSLPTLVVVHPDGKEPTRMHGFPGKREAMAFLRAAAAGHK